MATGVRSQLWAATGKKEELLNGILYHPIEILNGGSPCARNEKLTDELWEYTGVSNQKHRDKRR